MLQMTGMVMLTFSHTLSFAFFHLTGSPGIVLGKGDNEGGKSKSNSKGKGMNYSEQLFLTHSFCPLTGLFSFALCRFTLLCSGKVTMLKMTGMAMLTFSHTLSFAFFHSTGSPGIVLGKGDNKDGKGKSNSKGKGMDYSEQLFLTHSFCPLTGSQYHACRAGLLGQAGLARLERRARSG
jgi:hypothetical protein